MKKLITLVAAFAFANQAASATVLFDPTFTSGTTPPAGYTLGGTTSGNPPVFTPQPGTVTFGNGTMTSGDISAPSNMADITSTGAAPDSTTIESKLTFTVNYTSGTGNQANMTVFSLDTLNANNDVLDITFQPFDYNSHETNVSIDGGIAFGGGNKAGNTMTTYSDKASTDSLNGDTLTLDLFTTFSDVGGNATDTTTGTLSDSSGILYTYHIGTTASDNGGGFDPEHNPLTLNFGDVRSDNDGIIASDSGATIVFSSILVQTVPEPSTYALLLGGLGLLVWVVRRRMTI